MHPNQHLAGPVVEDAPVAVADDQVAAFGRENWSC